MAQNSPVKRRLFNHLCVEMGQLEGAGRQMAEGGGGIIGIEGALQ
jgi:hypothetical protein